MRNDWKPGEHLTAAEVNEIVTAILPLVLNKVDRQNLDQKTDYVPCTLSITTVVEPYSVVAATPKSGSPLNPSILSVGKPSSTAKDILFTNGGERLYPNAKVSGYVRPIIAGGRYQLKAAAGVVKGDVTGPSADSHQIAIPSSAILKPLVCTTTRGSDGYATFIGIAAGGTACVKKFQLFVLNYPTGGTFTLPIKAQAKDPDTGERYGAYVTENIAFPYNASTAQVKGAIESHSNIDPDEVIVTGSFGLASSPATITMPSGTDIGNGGSGEIDASDLVRSGLDIPRVYLSECCS